MKKTVLITGASSDIGLAIAKEFRGYNLVLHYYQNRSAVEEFARNSLDQVLIVQADISKEEEVKTMFEQIKDKFSSLDCVINNAAYTCDNAFMDKSAEEFKRVIEVNLLGTFLVSKYAGEMMLEQKSGNIVNISSTNGIDTESVLSMDYDASKAGVISLTKNFAHALAPHIQVNSVAPGWTETTPVMKMNPNDLKVEKEHILMERFATPEEIARVVRFVASEENSYMTGAIIRVDGGKK